MHGLSGCREHLIVLIFIYYSLRRQEICDNGNVSSRETTPLFEKDKQIAIISFKCTQYVNLPWHWFADDHSFEEFWNVENNAK